MQEALLPLSHSIPATLFKRSPLIVIWYLSLQAFSFVTMHACTQTHLHSHMHKQKGHTFRLSCHLLFLIHQRHLSFTLLSSDVCRAPPRTHLINLRVKHLKVIWGGYDKLCFNDLLLFLYFDVQMYFYRIDSKILMFFDLFPTSRPSQIAFSLNSSILLCLFVFFRSRKTFGAWVTLLGTGVLG